MDAIMNLLSNFDPANILPDLTSAIGVLELLARIFILIVPVILLVLGVIYFFRPPQEANHSFGYRTYFGMGSVEAWRFVQWLAGMVYIGLGGLMLIVMFLLGLGLKNMEIIDLLVAAIRYLIAEIILVALAGLAINVVTALRYDRDGYRRGQR